MDYIYNLISDWDLTDDINNGLRNRWLEQKVLYLQEWADLYYEDKNQDEIFWPNDFSIEELIDIGIKDNLWNVKGKNKAFISLWCGDSSIEKGIFRIVGDRFWKINYFGVDSSRSMLSMSIKNLLEFKSMDKKYVCADFSTNVFKRELTQMTSGYDGRVFAFLSNTFGNINPTNIVDILYNLLNKWERIWLDVRLRQWTKAKDDMDLFNMYNKYLKTKSKIFFLPLKRYWVPFEHGKMILSTHNEDSLGAIRFDFSFLFTKKTKIMAKNEEIVVLPKEIIKIQQIYAYDPDLLIKFFQEHGFNLIKMNKKNYRGHFIFEKI